MMTLYEEYLSTKRYSEFKYWFRPDIVPTTSDKYASTWRVVDKMSGQIIGHVIISDHEELTAKYIPDAISDAADVDILAEFADFKERRMEHFFYDGLFNPKYTDVETYERMLVSIMLIRAEARGTDPDIIWKHIDTCINWLRNSTFYTDPASSVYHESYRGGLLKHTLRVARCAIYQLQNVVFRSVRPEDAVLVAFVHDWCKIGFYESYEKNVKNDQTGQWEKVTAYRRSHPQVPLGHGAASLYIASKFFKLSLEEAAAIRWHMGKWRCVDDENDELQYANENYPIVHLLQFADQLSITNYI